MADEPDSKPPSTVRKGEGLVRWDGLAAMAREAAARFDKMKGLQARTRAAECRALATSFESWASASPGAKTREDQTALLLDLVDKAGVK